MLRLTQRPDLTVKNVLLQESCKMRRRKKKKFSLDKIIKKTDAQLDRVSVAVRRTGQNQVANGETSSYVIKLVLISSSRCVFRRCLSAVSLFVSFRGGGGGSCDRLKVRCCRKGSEAADARPAPLQTAPSTGGYRKGVVCIRFFKAVASTSASRLHQQPHCQEAGKRA